MRKPSKPYRVRLPMMCKDSDVPLQNVLARAARKAGLNSYQTAIVMTHFLESLVVEVCYGRVVTIPGFGQFGPWTYRSKQEKYKDLPPTCLPRFQASSPFKHEVMATAAPDMGVNATMTWYQRNHTTPRGKAIPASRSSTALAQFRHLLAIQANKQHVESSLSETG